MRASVVPAAMYKVFASASPNVKRGAALDIRKVAHTLLTCCGQELFDSHPQRLHELQVRQALERIRRRLRDERDVDIRRGLEHEAILR